MICLDRVVRVLLDCVQGRGDQLVEHSGVGGSTVSGDLGRDCAGAQRPGEETPGSGQVTPGRQQDVDDLAMLVNGPVEIGPRASDLHVCLVGEPPVTGSMAARPRRLDELGGEPLHPPVDSDVIDGDAALGQQLLDVPVGQPLPQVPPDRERDHRRREPEACEDRCGAMCSHPTSLRPSTLDQRNSSLPGPYRPGREQR